MLSLTVLSTCKILHITMWFVCVCVCIYMYIYHTKHVFKYTLKSLKFWVSDIYFQISYAYAFSDCYLHSTKNMAGTLFPFLQPFYTIHNGWISTKTNLFLISDMRKNQEAQRTWTEISKMEQNPKRVFL